MTFAQAQKYFDTMADLTNDCSLDSSKKPSVITNVLNCAFYDLAPIGCERIGLVAGCDNKGQWPGGSLTVLRPRNSTSDPALQVSRNVAICVPVTWIMDFDKAPHGPAAHSETIKGV